MLLKKAEKKILALLIVVCFLFLLIPPNNIAKADSSALDSIKSRFYRHGTEPMQVPV